VLQCVDTMICCFLLRGGPVSVKGSLFDGIQKVLRFVNGLSMLLLVVHYFS